MTTATAAPFRFFDAHVVRSARLGPSMVRVTFGGAQLDQFASGGRDQSFSLFLPHPGQSHPVVPTDAGTGWFARWRAMDPAERGVMRSYTVREQRREQGEVDVEFALHGDLGPASRWAGRARPGDRVKLLGPADPENKSVGFRPPEGTDWVLIAADETALPAVAGILDWLPAGTRARVWIEVPHAGDVRDLATRADATVSWLVRESAPAPRCDLLLDAVRSAHLPSGAPYAWIAGESGAVRGVRRHLVGERGFHRRRVTFSGYWRRGATEEDLRAEALSGAARDRA
ncbi:siderophore-interacting protein [Streptantibioticus cattleyicolor]|uniref:Siderophore-interacting protein n=1 Tax=Streptantibioticus cattleyicolor (strain ATCC 35852 / DSM 46488 / JCM 4925 / NBRC 14057 / NRRL 8057) TaxID=1003195 RepID=F8JJH6_STREN|nr:siderophore-interacting protein [Streptantibioticus cattleyicolor]AEW98699.1 siderophore-interacting protein [Streptantibioticus cattleyicolor NRRL 8057 = DSM 46488]CCB72246.1 Siderophore-interacting protein [Streptantibioticus cattleyicolor NRRL 8057 = DSM 46488]